MKRVTAASVIATASLAWLLAQGCGLNPQPEPPSAASGGGGKGTGAAFGAGASGTVGAGGASAFGGTSAAAGGASTGSGGMVVVTAPDASAAGGATGTGGQDAGTPPGDASAGCLTTATSSLPGVSIRFPSQPCRFTAAQASAGITFHYEIVVTQPVTILAGPLDAGGCRTPGPSGVPVQETVSGGGQSYCICDTGLCAPQPPAPVQLAPGVYPATFTWDGVNWTGPSDFGNPKGAPFPPGSYALDVGGRGSIAGDGGGSPYAVSGTLAVTITK